jgi:hypothetical protein
VTGCIWHNNRKAERPRNIGTIDHHPKINDTYIEYVVEKKKPRRHCSYGIRWK